MAQGQITINDEPAGIGQLVGSTDVVKYRGVVVQPQNQHAYILLNKPVGYITSAKDQFGRKTVLDLIPQKGLYPVGRLDYHTSGLLLLTNDGDFTYALTHPKHKIPKTYIVKINATPTPKEMKRLESGVYISGYKTQPCQASIIKAEKNFSIIKITITEGKNRQIRHMIEAIQYQVITLKRIAIANLELGSLQTGKYRYLTPQEVAHLKKL